MATSPSSAVPFSTMPNVPRQRSIQPSSATGMAHHENLIPVAIWSAIDTPPISDASTRKLTANTATSGSRKNRYPNRSRSRSAYVRLLTAASRPVISIRKARLRVPSRRTHASR
jgi:hypothetical protein